MGCDIHLHTEVKIGGKWRHYSAPNFQRNYKYFAKMANVRNYDEIEPISEPKGLPFDITEVTKFDADKWGSDAHSASWLGAEELVELEEFVLEDRKGDPWFENKTWGYLFGNTWGGFAKYPEDRPEGLEDVRFVFWFDN